MQNYNVINKQKNKLFNNGISIYLILSALFNYIKLILEEKIAQRDSSLNEPFPSFFPTYSSKFYPYYNNKKRDIINIRFTCGLR